MPSSQLSLLCEQIEKQDTDHFGKFYMYISLLNTLTVRNKTFNEGLPTYHRYFWEKYEVEYWGGNAPGIYPTIKRLYSRIY